MEEMDLKVLEIVQINQLSAGGSAEGCFFLGTCCVTDSLHTQTKTVNGSYTQQSNCASDTEGSHAVCLLREPRFDYTDYTHCSATEGLVETDPLASRQLGPSRTHKLRRALFSRGPKTAFIPHQWVNQPACSHLNVIKQKTIMCSLMFLNKTVAWQMCYSPPPRPQTPPEVLSGQPELHPASYFTNSSATKMQPFPLRTFDGRQVAVPGRMPPGNKSFPLLSSRAPGWKPKLVMQPY